MPTPKVGLLEALSEYTGAWESSRRALIACAGIAAIMDLVLLCVCYGSLHRQDGWSLSGVFQGIPRFTTDISDVLLLYFMKMLGLLLLFNAARRHGKPPEGLNVAKRQRWGFWGWKRREPQLSLREVELHDTPLLAGLDEEGQDGNEAEQDLNEARIRASKKKNLLVGAMYVLSSAFQAYLGVKCVSFQFTVPNEALQSTLLGLGVLWINVLSWALNELVKGDTKEEGFLNLELHPHRLRPSIQAKGHNCDKCSKRVKGTKSFRCGLCDFDLCLVCFNRTEKEAAQEGVIRSDKGIKKEVPLDTLAYLWRAFHLARPHWRLFTGGLFCLVLTCGARLAVPHFQGSILDAVVKADRESFKHFLGLYLSVSVTMGAISGAQRLCFLLVGRRMANLARNKLYRGIMKQDMAFFDGNASGGLTSRLTQDVSAMVSPCTNMLGILLRNTLLLIGGVTLCFITSWRLSMLAFTTMGPVIHITQVYAQWSRDLNRDIWVTLGEANSAATESLGNIRTVKALSTEPKEIKLFEEATGVALKKGELDALGGAGMQAINSYLDLGAGLAVLWYGGSLAMNPAASLTAGKLIAYQLYWNMLRNSYQALLNVVTNFTRAAGAAQRVFSLMDSVPDIDVNAGEFVPVRGLKGHISIEGLSFHYQMRPDKEVLSEIDLDIPAGSTCALVGRSGSGKSTLVHLLLRLYDPTKGCIKIDGKRLTNLQLRSMHREMAIVSQDTQLFGCSIEENITYGLDPSSFTPVDVIEAAKKACAHEFIMSFPEAYATQVGERGVRVSGGQKQRIAIARALLRRPTLLLLDEATSALDAESEAQVQKALDELIRGGVGNTTVVLVAHRLSTVMGADQIAVVDQGRIVETGTHERLVESDGIYHKLVKKQLKRQASALLDAGTAGDVIDDIMDEPQATPGDMRAANITGSSSRAGGQRGLGGGRGRGRFRGEGVFGGGGGWGGRGGVA